MLAIINKTHAHGSDVRPVGRKQNCTLSEKRSSNMYEIVKNVGNKKKKQTQQIRGISRTTAKSKTVTFSAKLNG